MLLSSRRNAERAMRAAENRRQEEEKRLMLRKKAQVHLYMYMYMQGFYIGLNLGGGGTFKLLGSHSLDCKHTFFCAGTRS